MKKIMTTAILALMISSSIFAQGRWTTPSRVAQPNSCYIPQPLKPAYHTPMTKTMVYPAEPARFAMPLPVEQCGPMAMDPRSFCQLKETMNRSAFESTKFTIFRQAMAYNYFTSQQVLDIMNQFCFESYRLDVAKMAYNKTVDPYNYYIVNNAFAFSSSVRELDGYLAMR